MIELCFLPWRHGRVPLCEGDIRPNDRIVRKVKVIAPDTLMQIELAVYNGHRAAGSSEKRLREIRETWKWLASRADIDDKFRGVWRRLGQIVLWIAALSFQFTI